MLPDDIHTQAEKIVRHYAEKKLLIATAESCTGGLVAAALTSVAGSSAVFEQGFVTYSNDAKIENLGVPASMIEAHGAVSPEVAVAMADGARLQAKAHVGISITGIAGPSGGSLHKPVGLVYIALSLPNHTEARRFLFEGARADVRRQATIKALSWLLAAGNEWPC